MHQCNMFLIILTLRVHAGSSSPQHITPIIIDVSKAEQIEAAVALIAASGKNLVALVNNAGMSHDLSRDVQVS